jgi:glycosyltransferase involved in cell wall biosynthesis
MNPFKELQNLRRCGLADEALSTGRSVEAAGYWGDVLRSSSSSGLLVRACAGLRKEGRALEVVQGLREICSKQPLDWRVRHELALAWFEVGERGKAIGEWREILAAEAPLSAGAVLKIASAFCEEGALVEALEMLKGAILRLGSTPKLRAALSNVEFEAGMRVDRPPNEKKLSVDPGGVLFIPIQPNGIWAQATSVLGFNNFSVVGKPDSDWKEADAFAVFDEGFERKGNRLCERLAEFSGKPLWRLQKNPLSSPEHGGWAFFVSKNHDPDAKFKSQAPDSCATNEELEEAQRCIHYLQESECGDPKFAQNAKEALVVGYSHSETGLETLQTGLIEKFLRGSRYFLEGRGVVGCGEYLERIAKAVLERSAANEESQTPGGQFLQAPTRSLRVLFVLPSGRFGATGRYIQTLAQEMIAQGAAVAVLADGDVPLQKPGAPAWWRIEFEGVTLAKSLRDRILGFAPDLVYLNGVRTRSQRAALEAVVLTGAALAMHSEDEDVELHSLRHGSKAAEEMTALDKPNPSLSETVGFLKANDWEHTLQVFSNPDWDRWTEPVLRAACQHLAKLHTAVWYPFAERLRKNFGVPVMVVPPVGSKEDFEGILLDDQERRQALEAVGISTDDLVLYVAGTIYSYSAEFEVFLKSCALAARKINKTMALVVSGRSELPLEALAQHHLPREIRFVNLQKPTDAVYTRFLKIADVVCSPCLPDVFNRYRLPSRLVRAMAMGKPVLTGNWGFGESLENGKNAFLTEGDNPQAWSRAILAAADSHKRAVVGRLGREFAEANFRAGPVCKRLLEQMSHLLEGMGEKGNPRKP